MTAFIEHIEFHGIEALRLNGPRGASAIVAKLGGQVLSWKTPDGRERLFLSDKAVFDGSHKGGHGVKAADVDVGCDHSWKVMW